MAKVALVLSGGGARGAFQFAAEKYAREVKGYQWDVIAGVSVGALNGTLLAMHKYERLDELWRTITKKQVMTGGINPWSILKLLFGAKSMCGNAPLWERIQGEVDPALIKTDLRIGAVSLRTGEYVRFRPTDPGFPAAVLASTAIPLVWAPVQVSPDYPDMVDGGVRNISPVGDVLDVEPDEVVIVNCAPRQSPAAGGPIRHAIDIAMLSQEIMANELFDADVREFLRINRLVQEAAAQGAILYKDDGRPYKSYRYKIIEPDQPLGDGLDFSRDHLDRMIASGWNKARKVLE